jgi:hypothetical protein
LFNSDTAIGNIVLNDLVFRHLLSESGSLFGTVAHEFECTFSDTDKAHAVVDATRS